MNVPNLDPYVPQNPWIVQTQSSILPIKFKGQSSNMLVYGLDKLEYTQLKFVYCSLILCCCQLDEFYNFLSFFHCPMYSGLVPNPFNTMTIRMTVCVPTLVIDTGFTTSGSVFLIGFKTTGDANAKLGMYDLSMKMKLNVHFNIFVHFFTLQFFLK